VALLFSTSSEHAESWLKRDASFHEEQLSGLLKFPASMSIANRTDTLEILFHGQSLMLPIIDLIEVRLGRQHSSTSLATTIIQARAPCPNEAEGHCAISSGGRRAGSLRRAILGKLITLAEVG
jgi:hypothetical protein